MAPSSRGELYSSTLARLCYRATKAKPGGPIMKLKSLMVAAVALAAASPITVHAVEVTAFVSNALKSTVQEHSVTLDKGSGVILKATYGTTEPLRLRIEKGEMVDFALLGEEAIDDLLKKGRLV